MDYRQLHAFIAVFEERNITGAARRLCLTQPALSATIKTLEENLGTPLFLRQSRGVEVTEDARILYPHARRMVAELDILARSFGRERHRQSLNIGVEHDIADSQLSAFLQHIRDPAFSLLVTLAPGCTGDIRFGCEELCCEDELFLPLHTDPFLLAIPGDHPLTAKTTVAEADLHGLCWVVCPELSSHQRLLPVYGATANSPAANAGTYSLALSLVMQGLGVAIVPESLAREHSQVVTRALPGHPLSRRTGVCYAVQSLSFPAVDQLIQYLMRMTR